MLTALSRAMGRPLDGLQNPAACMFACVEEVVRSIVHDLFVLHETRLTPSVAHLQQKSKSQRGSVRQLLRVIRTTRHIRTVCGVLVRNAAWLMKIPRSLHGISFTCWFEG